MQPDEVPVRVQPGVSPEGGGREVDRRQDKVGPSSVSLPSGAPPVDCTDKESLEVGGHEVNQHQEEAHGKVGHVPVSQHHDAPPEDVQPGQAQSSKVCL